MPWKLYRRGDSPNWYIRGTEYFYNEEGVRSPVSIDESARTADRQEAEQILQRLKDEKRRRNLTGVELAPTFAEAVEDYLNVDATRDDRFLIPLLDAFEHHRINRITQEDADRAAREAYPTAQPATIKRQWYTPLRAILNGKGCHQVAVPRAYRDKNKRTDTFTPEQVDKIIAYFRASRYKSDRWGAALITFLVGQGSRVGETLLVDAAADVELSYSRVILRPENTKNGEERTLRLIPKVKAALSTLPNLGEVGPLFRRYDGRLFKKRKNRGGQIRNRFRNAVISIGLDPERYKPHILRHTWGTWYYAQTLDVLRLRQQGGWNSEEYLRYVRIVENSPGLAEDVRTHGWEFCEFPRQERTAAELRQK